MFLKITLYRTKAGRRKTKEVLEMKRAQGISINVIVVAAIALLVLVVLSVVFLGRFGLFAQQSGDCENKGGRCVVGSCPSGTNQYAGWSCPETSSGAGQTCCLAVQS